MKEAPQPSPRTTPPPSVAVSATVGAESGAGSTAATLSAAVGASSVGEPAAVQKDGKTDVAPESVDAINDNDESKKGQKRTAEEHGAEPAQKFRRITKEKHPQPKKHELWWITNRL